MSDTVVRAAQVAYAYGRRRVLHDLSMQVPRGAVYALLGANGAGKSTLLRLLAGIEPLQSGTVTVNGTDVRALRVPDRQRIGYVAEGQSLPAWMRLEQLEAFCAPLYDTWDHDFASHLRARFALDPRQQVGSMSRGQRMKAALLCALAPRPSLLLMDEPFTGIDVVVKEELIGGLLESASSEQWTLVIATHDVDEIEPFVDYVGFLRDGRIDVAGALDDLRESVRHVEAVYGSPEEMPARWPASWTQYAPVQRSGLRVSAFVSATDGARDAAHDTVRAVARTYEERALTLRELYKLFGAVRNVETGGKGE